MLCRTLPGALPQGRGVSRRLARLIFAALLSLTAAHRAPAQTTGTTAPGAEPGRPAGSYQLSGFESVNLYNGNLNFQFPLLAVGGRGGAGLNVTLAFNNRRWRSQRWMLREEVAPAGDICVECRHGSYWIDNQLIVQDNGLPFSAVSASSGSYVSVTPDPLLGLEPGYGPGVLKGVQAWNRGASAGSRGYALTRLTFTTPDGTEHQFVDRDTYGEPKAVGTPGGFSRGTVFVSHGGGAATFIADEPVRDVEHRFDIQVDLPARLFYPSGHLLLADGTRYRVVRGLVRWLRDRNGNVATFGYDEGGRVTSINDPLGRQVTITYAAPGTPYDQLNFKGFGGEARAIRVHRARLESAFRPGAGYAVRTYPALFPALDTSGDATPHNPPGVATAVELPDGGRYELRYNPYGDLERVELPTGGAFEYRYEGVAGQPRRRVAERLVFEDKHDALPSGRQVYAATQSAAPSATRTTTVSVSEQDGHGTQLARSVHSFYGVEGSYSFGFYPSWREGREFRVEAYAADGATVLRRSELAWRQRAPVPWYTQSQEQAPACDPRLVETTTTLEPAGANLTSKSTSLDPQTGAAGFDQFNNQTDVYEYDYGAPGTGRHGALLRRTHVDYVTEPAYVDAAVDPSDGAHLRALPARRWVSSDEAGAARQSLTLYEYDRHAPDARHAPLVARPGIIGLCLTLDDAGACARASDASFTRRGNLTGITTYADAAAVAGPVTVSAQYDVAGNVVRSLDARGHASSISYEDSFCNGAGCGGGAFTPQTYAFATGAASPVPDPAGRHAAASALTTSTVYDFWTGLPSAATDANGQVTRFEYEDRLDRRTAVVRPTGGGRTDFAYSGPVEPPHLRASADLDATRRLESREEYDGLGRAVRSFTFEGQDAARPWLTVDTEFDARGSVRRTSNPYRSAGPGSAVNPSGRWTKTSYDALGRVTEVETPDGAKVTSAYEGDRVMVTDQAGRRRVSRSDALGRLTDVWEVTPADAWTVALDFGGATHTGYRTSYAYDAAGNLRKVEQGGQLRFYAYDSLGRLVRARNPERGVMNEDAAGGEFPPLADPTSGNDLWSLGYKYDEAGNLTRRRDARGVTTAYAYDALNRNISINYSDATPDVTRFYDGAALGRGRPWKSEAAGAAAATVTAYDAAGRPTSYSQRFWTGGAWGPDFAVARAYDLAGHVRAQTYPSGRAVSYAYDAAGRLAAFDGTLGDDVRRTYSAAVLYDEAGEISREQFGTREPLFNKRSYNLRGQLTQVRLGTSSPDPGWWNRGAIINHYTDRQWGGDGPENNGNLRAQDVYVPRDERLGGYWVATQRYAYDSLNRLTKVVEAEGGADRWAQGYEYDRWGNRTVDADATQVYGNNPTYSVPEPQFDPRALSHSNRLYAPGDLDPGRADAQRRMRYDGAGNLTLEPCHDGRTPCTRVYDAEGRLTRAQFLGGQVQEAAYVYDAEGRRVRRKAGAAGEVWQVYGLDGELLAEYEPGSAPARPRREYGYRAGELLVVLDTPDGRGRANFALASAGASAAASSTLDPARAPAGAINGDRSGSNWGAGGGWHDATNNSYPDWLEVDFGSAKTIDEVNVFSVQDTYWSPQEPSDAAAFTQYGLVDFDVQRWDGSQWLTLPGGEVRGNRKVWRRLTFAPVTAQKVRVLVRAAQAGHSRVAELEAWGPAGPPPARLNVAAAAAGAAATASSTLDAGRDPSGTVNGDRAGRDWGAGGGWHDATGHAFPDWLEVSFGGARSVDEVHVFSVQDDFLSPAEPTEQATFTRYGVTDFDVEYWDGAAWRTAATVAGNNLVWRKVSFPAVTTPKIRVVVRGGAAGYSRVAEVEAYGAAGRAEARWLVADQLGTPRLVVGESGGFDAVTRHDYLPFGEELVAGVGGRPAHLGYSQPDGVRQGYTGAERDDETGLNFMRARYYSSTQGRFTSPDPVAGQTRNPQTLNLYAYVRNNPLRYADPSGLTPQDRTRIPSNNGGLDGCIGSDCRPGIPWETVEVVGTSDVLPVTELEIMTGGLTPIPTIPLPGGAGGGGIAHARLVLDGIGMWPGAGEPFNIISGILGFYEGDYFGGGLSLFSAIPALGNISGAASLTRAAGRLDNATGLADDALEGGGQIIYRSGNPSPSNLTPRAVDDGHLSFRDSLSNPYPLAPGQQPVFGLGDSFFGIDVTRLPPSSVVPDNMPPGHVSVRGVPPAALKDAATLTGVRGKFPK